MFLNQRFQRVLVARQVCDRDILRYIQFSWIMTVVLILPKITDARNNNQLYKYLSGTYTSYTELFSMRWTLIPHFIIRVN